EAIGAAVEEEPAVQLPRLLLDDRLDLFVPHAEQRQRAIVDDAHPLRNRADAELGLARRPELARDRDVEGGVQRPGDLVGHGHAPAGQAEDEGILVAEVGEGLGEPAPGVVAVSVLHRGASVPNSPATVTTPNGCGNAPPRGRVAAPPNVLYTGGRMG